MSFLIMGIMSKGSSFAVRKFVDLSLVECKIKWIFFSLSGQIKSSLTLKFDMCGPRGLAHYPARTRSARARRARALRALGLLLADGAPTVGGGKTF